MKLSVLFNPLLVKEQELLTSLSFNDFKIDIFIFPTIRLLPALFFLPFKICFFISLHFIFHLQVHVRMSKTSAWNGLRTASVAKISNSWNKNAGEVALNVVSYTDLLITL